jgi:hypothetical protein
VQERAPAPDLLRPSRSSSTTTVEANFTNASQWRKTLCPWRAVLLPGCVVIGSALTSPVCMFPLACIRAPVCRCRFDGKESGAAVLPVQGYEF